VASAHHYTLDELELMLIRLQNSSKANVQRLDQAVSAMRAGGVGASILDVYDQIQDGVEAIRDAAVAADTGLDSNRALRDAYAAVPDAGDKKFLTGE
jgi:hypothetical protein